MIREQKREIQIEMELYPMNATKWICLRILENKPKAEILNEFMDAMRDGKLKLTEKQSNQPEKFYLVWVSLWLRVRRDDVAYEASR